MFKKLITFVITSPVIIYFLRCIIALIIGYTLLLRFPDYEMLWTLISIILVISPEGQNSAKLSVERFKSNLIGSIAALICLAITPNVTLLLCLLGVFITITLCYAFKILNMARVALVALIIILIQPHTTTDAVEITPIIRTLAVTSGCFIGLAITVITSMIIKYLKRSLNIALS